MMDQPKLLWTGTCASLRSQSPVGTVGSLLHSSVAVDVGTTLVSNHTPGVICPVS